MSMRLDYSEKRSFNRMQVDCVVEYRLPGADRMAQARGQNLSAGGVQFETGEEISVGTPLEIVISPEQKLTPPLEAVAEVVRVVPSGDGGYIVSCRFQQMKG